MDSSPISLLKFAKIAELKQSSDKASTNDNKLTLKFVDIDAELEQLERLSQKTEIDQIRESIAKLRNKLFELCNLAIYGLNISNFASHEPHEKTPLTSERA